MFGLGMKTSSAPRVAGLASSKLDTEKFIAEISEEERRLADDLAKVLARPVGHAEISDAGLSQPNPGFGYEPDNLFDLSDRGFKWNRRTNIAADHRTKTSTAPDIPADEADLIEGVAPLSTKHWLQRARRERFWARTRRAASLAFVVLVIGAIAVLAGYVMTGQSLNLGALIGDGHQRLL